MILCLPLGAATPKLRFSAKPLHVDMYANRGGFRQFPCVVALPCRTREGNDRNLMSSGEPNAAWSDVPRRRVPFRCRDRAHGPESGGVSRRGPGERADAVIFGHRRTAEAAQLRGDKPHPVAALPACPRLPQHRVKRPALAPYQKRHPALPRRFQASLTKKPFCESEQYRRNLRWRASRPACSI
jgi:hypothetical protein